MTEKQFQEEVLKKLDSIEFRVEMLSERNEEYHRSNQQYLVEAFQKISWHFDLPTRIERLERELEEIKMGWTTP